MINNINTYLQNLDKKLQLEKSDKEKIERSIGFIKQKLWGLFQDRLHDVRVFGSYPKETFVSQDDNADVDILVIFKNKEFQPQTYLNQIKSFANEYYSRSNIYPDHPTIVIELEHIKFEIVPGINVSNDEVRIPAPRTKDLKWIPSYPTRIHTKLNDKDKTNKGFIKPAIRIIKYLNAINDKSFTSFEIEKQIVNKVYYDRSSLKDYFYDALLSLDDIATTESQKKFIANVKERKKRLRALEINNLDEYIELEMTKFIPFQQ